MAIADARPAARRRRWPSAAAALPSICRGGLDRFRPGVSRQDLSPRTITIEESGKLLERLPVLKRQEVSFARNSQSQSANAGSRRRWWRRQRRRYPLHDGLRLLLVVVLCSATNISSSPSRTAPAHAADPAASCDSQLRAGQAASQSLALPDRCIGAAHAPAGTTPAIAAAAETETTVENELYRIVFTNRGAQVKHWILKKYNDTGGKPLDMVQPQAAAQFGLPLSFFTYEPALTHAVESGALSGHCRARSPRRRAGARARRAHLSLRGKWPRRGEDLPLRLELRDRRSTPQVKRNGSPVRALVQWPAASATWRSSFPRRMTRSTDPYAVAALPGRSTASRTPTLRPR